MHLRRGAHDRRAGVRGLPAGVVLTGHGDGVVTPHASFLALRYAPEAALQNLANLEADFDCWADGGFLDSVAVRSGRVSRRHLAVGQGMVMAALGNALAGDSLREHVSGGTFARTPEPLVRQEVFASRAAA